MELQSGHESHHSTRSDDLNNMFNIVFPECQLRWSVPFVQLVTGPSRDVVAGELEQ